MPSFRAVIIDDEEDARSLLRIFLQENYPSIEVVSEADSVRSGKKVIINASPDVVFLDVQMQDGTGFDLLKQLQEIDFRIIFVTSYDQYAIEAFRYNAIDYLLKPIDPEEFQQTVGRLRESVLPAWHRTQIKFLLQSVEQKKTSSLLLSTAEGHHVIPFRELVVVESEHGYTFFHMESGERIITSKWVGQFEELLVRNNFFRVHTSFVVNLSKVRRIVRKDGDLAILKGGYEVPISRRRKDDFYRVLSEQ